jgi:S-DNA-T family DNA segregation ATPase FtsK/SpoIIIE
MSEPYACDECGYVYDTPPSEIPGRLRALGPRYAEVLASTTKADLPAHTTAGVWSPLEYCCHMRDVLTVQRERTLLAQEQDEPRFASMRREERVSEERYNEQDPQRVAKEITEAAEMLAATLESLGDAGWRRTGVYNYPEVRVRDVVWIGNHTIHEGEHHLFDIARLLGR